MADEKDSKFEQTKGNVKETVGNATGNKDMEKNGKKDKNSGKAKEYVEKASNKANDTIDKVSDKFKK